MRTTRFVLLCAGARDAILVHQVHGRNEHKSPADLTRF